VQHIQLLNSKSHVTNQAIAAQMHAKFMVNLSGFLQVRENWKKLGNLCGHGKILFLKSQGK